MLLVVHRLELFNMNVVIKENTYLYRVGNISLKFLFLFSDTVISKGRLCNVHDVDEVISILKLNDPL